MMHHAVKLSVAGFCNAALLVALLACIKSADAFVAIRSIAAIPESAAGACPRCAALSAPWSSPSTKARPGRSQRIAPSFTPVPLSCGRRRRKAGYGGFRAIRCCVDNRRPEWAASCESDNYGCPPAGVQTTSRRDVSDTGEASGFGWLREFGNGKIDVVGLILSTVLLMTAVAPIGIAADLGVVDGGRLDQHRPRQGPAARLAVEYPGRVAPQPWEAKATPAGLAMPRTERVSALRLGDMAPRHAPVPPSSGVSSRGTTDSETTPRRTGPLAQMAGNAASSARDVAKRAMAIGSRVAEQDSLSDSSRPADAENPVMLEEKPGPKTKIPPLFSIGGVDTGSALSPGKRTAPATSDAARADPAGLLNKLEVEHAKLYGESLPLPTMPESFNHAIRKALPALVPPAMAIFLTVSMPAVILLLKGIGTTVVAVAKGYGKGDRRRAEDDFEAGAPLQVGFGGEGSGRDRRRGRSAENPGSAFQMFLGANGGGGGISESRPGEPGSVERKSSFPADKSSVGDIGSSSLPPQQVETDRQDFFSKHNRSNGGGSGGGGKNPSGGGFAVGDDAMTAMAMVAMTQELSIMKQSLQTEVETMKQELERASDDSRRLADKLVRLEEDNRHLKAMVSRLGGQDARRLKAQLFSLLASPSMAQLKDGSPQTQLTPA